MESTVVARAIFGQRSLLELEKFPLLIAQLWILVEQHTVMANAIGGYTVPELTLNTAASELTAAKLLLCLGSSLMITNQLDQHSIALYREDKHITGLFLSLKVALVRIS